MTEESRAPWPLEIAFTYRHDVGDLRPFFDALAEGRLLGARCVRCGRRWCPPRLVCPVDGAETAWVELSGRGTLRAVTFGAGRIPPKGPAGEFAWGLVDVDGCDNAATVRLSGSPGGLRPGARVRLAPPEGPAAHPIQRFVFAPVGEER